MRKNRLLIVCVFSFLICCNKSDMHGIAMTPGSGVEGVLVGKIPANSPNELMIFTDEAKAAEYIYTENSKYYIDFGKTKIKVGTSFDSLDKSGLIVDESNSRVMRGTLYTSKRGFFISVDKNKIIGIGVCKAG